MLPTDGSSANIFGDVAGMVGAFESLWLQIGDGQGNTSQLIRVDPDLSTATVELPRTPARRTDESFPSADPRRRGPGRSGCRWATVEWR